MSDFVRLCQIMSDYVRLGQIMTDHDQLSDPDGSLFIKGRDSAPNLKPLISGSWLPLLTLLKGRVHL